MVARGGRRFCMSLWRERDQLAERRDVCAAAEIRIQIDSSSRLLEGH
jgi:hypothetical protein